MRTQTLFDDARLTINETIAMSLETLRAYRDRFDHWVIAFSGGKDSSSLVTFVAWAIREGHVRAPLSLTVLYADTRMELPPLNASALAIMDELREREKQLEDLLKRIDKTKGEVKKK